MAGAYYRQQENIIYDMFLSIVGGNYGLSGDGKGTGGQNRKIYQSRNEKGWRYLCRIGKTA
jgi:hypothetical protein